jgi:hypothetical protein
MIALWRNVRVAMTRGAFSEMTEGERLAVAFRVGLLCVVSKRARLKKLGIESQKLRREAGSKHHDWEERRSFKRQKAQGG